MKPWFYLMNKPEKFNVLEFFSYLTNLTLYKRNVCAVLSFMIMRYCLWQRNYEAFRGFKLLVDKILLNFFVLFRTKSVDIYLISIRSWLLANRMHFRYFQLNRNESSTNGTTITHLFGIMEMAVLIYSIRRYCFWCAEENLLMIVIAILLSAYNQTNC